MRKQALQGPPEKTKTTTDNNKTEAYLRRVGILAGMRADDAGDLAAGRLQQRSDAAGGRLDEGHDLRAQLVEGRHL